MRIHTRGSPDSETVVTGIAALPNMAEPQNNGHQSSSSSGALQSEATALAETASNGSTAVPSAAAKKVGPANVQGHAEPQHKYDVWLELYWKKNHFQISLLEYFNS